MGGRVYIGIARSDSALVVDFGNHAALKQEVNELWRAGFSTKLR